MIFLNYTQEDPDLIEYVSYELWSRIYNSYDYHDKFMRSEKKIINKCKQL